MGKKNFVEFYEKLLSGPADPDKEFILSGQTYGGIYELATGIKGLLNTDNSDELICLCTDSKAIIMAAILASLGGGPSILLPHSYSKSVIEEIKNTMGFTLVLTDTPEKIPSGNEIATPDQIKGSRQVLKPRDPESLFLRLFTGGSTGKPKIWHKTPRNMISEALYHSNAFNVSKEDIFVSTVPPQHIYGLLHAVLIPFISGAKATGKTPAFPQEIISSIKDNAATVLVSIPMHYRVLKGSAFKLPSLRLALSSGGSLDYSDAEYFYSQTGIEVAEIFGSTETGGIAVRYNSGKEKAWTPLEDIDWKIDNDRLIVRSEFISPDLPKDNDGFFITEDRIETTGNNSFTHLGRADGVIKVAGKRVDLKEIEGKLKEIPGIADAVAISMPAAGGRGNDIAVIIEGSVDRAYVKRAAKDKLPPYAVPRKIKIVDKIPVLPTGKYDRQRIEAILKGK